MKIKSKSEKSSIFSGLFLIVFGIIFVIGALIPFLVSKASAETGIKTTAEIVDIDYYKSGSSHNYNVFVEFEVDGKTYSGRLDFYSSSMNIGDTVSIYYNADNPNDFTYGENMLWFYCIFWGVGGLTIVIGIYMIFESGIKKKKLQALKQNGLMRTVEVEEVNINTSFSANGKHPVKIICKDAHGKIFKTKFYGYDTMGFTKGDTVNVYIDTNDENKYIFDLESRKSPSQQFNEYQY